MNGYSLSPYERETVILFSDGDGIADVYTHDTKLIRRLGELSEKYPEEFVLAKSDGRSVTYRIPKKYVTIRSPYSEERRERQRQDAIKYGLPFMRKEGSNA